MTADLHNLIEALRNELQQYGEMLALLEHQRQEWAPLHNGDGMGESLAAMQAQGSAIQLARQRRQTIQQELAKRISRPENAPLSTLVPLLPEEYRPLINALVQENNELLQRVGELAQQNHRTLRESVELMQQLISALRPTDLSASLPPDSANPGGEASNIGCCAAVA